jgi:hypothetical protein
MAVNTDALGNIDPSAIGTATDTLLPQPSATGNPVNVPVATPAPTDPSTSAAPSDPNAAPVTTGQAPAGQLPAGQAPVAQTPQNSVVNGTSGGSGTRVSGSTNYDDDDEYEDHDDDEGEGHGEDDDD